MNNRAVNQYQTVRAAAVQAAPVPYDTKATIDKLERLATEAAENGATLVVFGEAFLSGFAIWNNVIPPYKHHDFQKMLVDSAIEVPGPETERLGGIARKLGINLSVGVNEISPISVGTVWNANLIFNSQGQLVNHRRKLVATWSERLTWAHGDGYDLEPVELDGVRVGMLMCGENTNPLAKYSLLAQGEEIHISSYPPAWPFDASPDRPGYDLAESIRLRSAAHSFEGKVFNVVAATALDEAMLELVVGDDQELREVFAQYPCVSMILGPTGTPLCDPLVRDEGIIYADLNTGDRVVPKQAHDVVGTYNRMDVFQLHINKERQEPIHLTEKQGTQRGSLPSEESRKASGRNGHSDEINAYPQGALS